MRTLIAITALLLSPLAHADSIGILGCGMNVGIGIEISILPGNQMLDAQIVENANSAARLSSFRVQQVPRTPGRLGEPLVFKGKNFELSLAVTARRVHGQVPARLTALSVDGRRLRQDLLCTIY